MKIFLMSPNWIGDCVMSLPAVRALKKILPETEIFIVTKPHLSSIYKNIPEICKIVEIPHMKKMRNFLKAIRELRKYKIKQGILFPNSFKSALLMRLAGVKHLTGYSKDLRGWMLKRKRKFNGKSVHQIQSYLSIIEIYLGREAGGVFSNTIIFTDSEKELALKTLKDNGVTRDTQLIGISPSAAYGPSKEWPVSSFIKLIDNVSQVTDDSRFIVFGSDKDSDKIGKISDSVSVPVIVIGGAYSLREAITIISLCDVFVGNDSGLLHVADGAGVPSIGIFGPTSPAATSPPADITESIYKNVECSPCSFKVCPVDHKCMGYISSREISDKVINLLNAD